MHPCLFEAEYEYLADQLDHWTRFQESLESAKQDHCTRASYPLLGLCVQVCYDANDVL